MVVAIGIILLAITTVNINYAVKTSRGDGALYTLMARCREARDTAIARRRRIVIGFQMPNQMIVSRVESSGDFTLLNQVFLEGNVVFTRFSGLPDTPDGFGAADAVDFKGETPVFLADGSMVGSDGAPISGTVFLGIPNEPASARAITIFGGTGQVNGYKWNGTAWVKQ